MSNWNTLGAVTLKGPNVNTKTFDSIEAFVASYHYNYYPLTDNITKINSIWKTKEARLAYYDRYGVNSTLRDFYNFDNICYLTDELGLIVPLWRIQEAVDARPVKSPRRWKSWRRHSNWNGRRHPGTLNELRAEAGFERDEDIRGFKVKSRRRHLVTAWDDQYRADHRDRSWKTNRKTQYKTVDI
jgi:hypothetical protein